MENAESSNAIELSGHFTDVLYLTDQGSLPAEIKRLLKLRKLSCRVLSIEKFSEVRGALDQVGTAIIDVKGSTIGHQQLTRIIETLEKEHVGVILLKGRVTVPIKSFSLAPASTSFSISPATQSLSIDELWMQISVNLAYRKGNPQMAVQPAIPPRQVQSVHRNKLAEQLNMTKALADNLTEQLRLAGLVQQDFLPMRLPSSDQVQWATVFLPAEWVSGDIYDIVRIDEQHIGFYIADVVGHGMPAALLTIFLKQALVMRETVGNSYRLFSPAEVVKNLNMRMAAQKLSGYQFATCCYCLLNTRTLQLTYARAGHPYPVLLRRGKPPQQLEVRGSLLGIFEQAEYIEQTVQLEAGDKILLYSDGAEPFIGKFDDRGGFIFSQEFCQIKDVPIVEMVDALNARVQNMQLAPAEVDDITIVGLDILSGPASV